MQTNGYQIEIITWKQISISIRQDYLKQYNCE